ncbi:hypothetical protein [Pedobacter caeni]|uniref:WG containing repeat-containing protein n=1 Tax=Pedobacter caeni TaxID=288992 RepID=A0A1M5AU66_9SPHI|nr:hypothetical protein [Pedobacter caeni]SHF33492.1 hypothetical protein SAMN04488522_102880 [Pedobacter caeni]
MYKLLILFLSIPLFSMAQDDKDEQLYLTADHEISKEKTAIKCILNEDLSVGYVKCYDGINENNTLLKQLNKMVHVDDALKPNQYSNYVKSTGYEQYLVGDFKDGKPYNGFFRADRKKVNEWLLFDFYKDGVLTMQWYNNLFHTIESEDNRLNFITLNSESTFLNAELQDGMEIIPATIKRGAGEVVRFVKDRKTSYIMLGLYAENYGEMIKITPDAQGFLISSVQRSSAKVSFSNNGRKLEYFDNQNKLVNKVELIHTELNATENIDPKQMIMYFQKGNKIYQEQLKNPKDQKEDPQGKYYSPALEWVAQAIFSTADFNIPNFVGLLENDGWRIGRLGYHTFIDGKEIGLRYRNGDQEGTYSMDFYEKGKISRAEELSIKNKTPDQIAEILKIIK